MAMRIKATLVLFLFSIQLGGCDLFQTRTPEEPLESGSPWIPPTQAEQVFVNMSQAVAELNSDHYLRCLFSPDDPKGTFLFVQDPEVAGWPLQSQPWGYEEEKQTIEYLFSLMSPEAPGYLAFGESEKTVYGDEDSVRVSMPYTMVVPLNDPSLNLPQEVTGQAEFYLAQTDIGYWAIYRWMDIEGDPSWTELKAGLY